MPPPIRGVGLEPRAPLRALAPASPICALAIGAATAPPSDVRPPQGATPSPSLESSGPLRRDAAAACLGIAAGQKLIERGRRARCGFTSSVA